MRDGFPRGFWHGSNVAFNRFVSNIIFPAFLDRVGQAFCCRERALALDQGRDLSGAVFDYWKDLCGRLWGWADRVGAIVMS